MKKLTAAMLILTLLAGCAAPVAESPVPTTEPTPIPAEEATPAPTQAATPSPTAEPTPTPDRGNLTEEQVEQVNRAFSARENPEFDADFMAVSGFFTSYYDNVRELDFAEFLWYYPSEYGVGEEEFAALTELPGFYWGKEYFAENGRPLIPQSLPVPTCRILRSSVDETLKKYAGITTAELKNTDGVLYMPEYDAYYTFTSDFGPGSFTCVGGRVEGDVAVLWSEERDIHGNRDMLTLHKEGERWYICSFLREAVDRGVSLTAFLQGLTGEEVRDVSSGWGFGKQPDGDAAAELVRKAAQNSVESWTYKDDDWEERTVWDMNLTLADGRRISLGAGVKENIVEVTLGEKTAYYRSPELYWALRTEYDSGGDGKGTVDQKALEKYREAVDDYLAQQAFAPEVRVELTAFTLVQENPALNAQVWSIGTALTTDPPELAPRMVGNGYVDSKLRMYPITSDGPENLLVTAEGEALGFQGWRWQDAGGLDQYTTLEELKEAMNGR